MLYEEFLVSVLLYGSEIRVWREKERSEISVVKLDKLRGLLDIWRIDRVPNERIIKLCGVV